MTKRPFLHFALAWVIKSQWRDWKTSSLFILCLSLGLLGLITLFAFKSNFDSRITKTSQEFLAADLAVSARRPLGQDQVDLARSSLPSGSQSAQMIEMFSMLSVSQQSPASQSDWGQTLLVQVRALSSSYPLYGNLIISTAEKHHPFSADMSDQARHKGDQNDLREIYLKERYIDNNDIKKVRGQDLLTALTPSIWLYPEIGEILNVKIGDEIKLGETLFKIAGWVIQDSSQTFRLASLAPRAYMHLDQLPATGLIQWGSTLSDSLLFKLPEEARPRTKDYQKVLEKTFPDPTIRVVTAQEASEQSVQGLLRVLDFVGLNLLLALLVSLGGVSFLTRYHFENRKAGLELLRIIGLPRRKTQVIYLLEVLALSLASAVFVNLCLVLLFSATHPLMERFWGEGLVWTFKVSLYSFFLSLVFPFMMALTLLGELGLVLEKQMREKSDFFCVVKTNLNKTFSFLAATVVLGGLAFLLAPSWKILGSLALILVAVSGLIWVILKLMIRVMSLTSRLLLSSSYFWILKQVRARWSYEFNKTFLSFSVFTLASLVLMTVLHLRSSFLYEIQTSPEAELRPSLFLFDIQDDQIESLVGLAEQREIPWVIQSKAPLVRARILKINGQPFERQIQTGAFITREEETEVRFRNRGVNLSFSNTLNPSERLAAGRDFTSTSKPDNGVARLSIEKRYARRLGLKIGDQITFDIQGVSVTGQVWNFRTVKWNSFLPNFFIIFEEGFLEDAPKSWLMSLKVSGDVMSAQRELAQSFPNISSILVERLISGIIGLGNQFVWVVLSLSGWILAISLVVYFILLIVDFKLRSQAWFLYRVVGAKNSAIARLGRYELGSSLVVSSALGNLLAWVLTYVLCELILDMNFRADWISTIGFFLLTILLAALLSEVLFQRWQRNRGYESFLRKSD